MSRNYTFRTPLRSRLTPRKLAIMIVVAIIHILAIVGLLRAFDIDVVPDAVRSITSFAVPAESPSPSPEPPRVEEVEPEGASGEEAPRAQPRETAAPQPQIIVREASPAPRVSAQGDANRSGAADSGAGTGGGGPGIGTGSGGSGTGSGGIAYTRRAEKIAGEIRTRDYPRASASDRDGAYVIIHFTVGTEGRPSDCRIAQSSGDAEVDRITCRLAVERFRYRPAIDGQGNPVTEKVGWKQWWWR